MNASPPPRPFVEAPAERSAAAASDAPDPLVVVADARPFVPPRPALPGTPARDREYAVLVLRTAEELDAHLEAWDALASAASEPNPFYEAFLLRPALAAFAARRELEWVLVFGYGDRAPSIDPVLCGLFPLERRRTVGGVPVRHRAGWRHDYCFSGAPLVRAGRERAVVEAFLDELASRPDGGGIVRFDQWPADGAVHAAFFDALDRRGAATYVRSRAARAFLRPSADARTYFGEALAPKRRKEFGRLERRLTESGRVRFDALAPDGDVGAWIAEFVALEAKGWKGREGTAFAARSQDRAWLETVTRGAFARGRLQMLALRHGGAAIAFKVNFLAADGAFGFKIAFDEAWGRFSPGVLLEIENVRRLHADGAVRWMDSCADPHHPMANRLWSGRRVYEDFFFALRGGLASFVVAAMPLARFVRGAFRRGPSGGGTSRSDDGPAT